MIEKLVYSAGPQALLRAAILPKERTLETKKPLDVADAESMMVFLAALTADPIVSEALQVANPPLSRRLRAVLAGEPVSTHRIRSLVFSVTRYLLRMTTRTTPFGLFSGVCVASFAESSTLTWPTTVHKGVRPDAEWLLNVVRDCERDQAVLGRLRVVVNNLGHQRGDRWVMPYLVQSRNGLTRSTNNAEASVRLTAAVRQAIDEARRPIRFDQLAERIQQVFPSASSRAISGMLGQLVDAQILLTELRPQPDEAEPLEHVLNTLESIDQMSVEPLLRQLKDIRGSMQGYGASPPGAGCDTLNELTERMNKLSVTANPVRVDARLGAEVQLPVTVVREAERVATALWRMSPRAVMSPSLRRFHEAFLERYGTRSAVPVMELLDHATGLGVPQGYSWPPTGRLRGTWAVDQTSQEEALRHEIVTGLTMAALLDGSREISLTDEDLDALALSSDSPPSPSMDLSATLVAANGGALDAGEFHLVLNPHGLSRLGGSITGRFAHLLRSDGTDGTDGTEGTEGTDGRNQMSGCRDLIPIDRECDRDNLVRATLTYRSPSPGRESLMAVPHLFPYRVAVGCFADDSDPSVLALDDLAVAADHHRLFVLSRRLGKEVLPTAVHMQTQVNAPNVARLLREIGLSGTRACRPWDWGSLEAAPYHPRVRSGRTILAPGRWRTSDGFFHDSELTEPQWTSALRAWSERWRVPDRIRVGFEDRLIELDLTVALHTRLLREEIRRQPRSVVYETPEEAAGPDGWLSGPEGRHASEIVIPMTARAAEPARAAGAPRTAPTFRTSRVGHLPGGEWLYAKVYSPEERHSELLADNLSQLVCGLPDGIDRWFFVRYLDPEPHVRVRFHGAPETLHGVLLPELRRWVGDLCDRRLAAGLVLDTYEPETERYGGPEVLTAAERVFHADSVAALAQLAVIRRSGMSLDPLLLGAMNYIDIARNTCPSGSWASWFTENHDRNEPLHRSVRPQRQAALSLLNDTDEPVGLGLGAADNTILSVWASRAKALASYRDTVGGKAAVASLLHMHHNRLIGMNRMGERRIEAVVRGVAEAHLTRRRLSRED